MADVVIVEMGAGVSSTLKKRTATMSTPCTAGGHEHAATVDGVDGACADLDKLRAGR